MKFEDDDAVIRIQLEIENRREDFLDRVFQEAGWGEHKASLPWCVGVHIGDAITKLLSEPKHLQECLAAIKDSIEGRIDQFRV
jgi:hypothetical protein